MLGSNDSYLLSADLDVPSVKTTVWSAGTTVYELEIVNPTNGAITFEAWKEGTPERVWIPTQTIGANAMMTYVSAHGRVLPQGFAWVASEVGLLATIRARKQ